MKYLIIGGVAGGATAAARLRRIDENSEIILLEKGKIETTVTRAKEVRAMTEKMITIAKENNLHNQRLVMAFVILVFSKLMNENRLTSAVRTITMTLAL